LFINIRWVVILDSDQFAGHFQKWLVIRLATKLAPEISIRELVGYRVIDGLVG